MPGVIPAELRTLPQWVLWRVETRRKPSGGVKATKVPYDPKSPRRRAQSTNPATWGTYRDAVACLDADGVGFVFAPEDPYCGIDMDNCVSATGAIHPAAWDVVRKLDGYVEFSPSGRGLHVIVRASISRGRHTLKTEWGDEFAIYTSGRFFTMLGNGRGQPREAQDAVNALIAYYFPEDEDGGRERPPVAPRKPVSDDDAAIIDRMLGDTRCAALWAGDCGAHGGDHSQADLALVAHLAFFTGNDAARMDSLFRRSGLMRDKWDAPRGDSTYGQQTIDRALRRS